MASHLFSRLGILQQATDRLFYTLSIVTVPLYLLSVLWMKFNNLTYTVITILALLQLSIWIYWIIQLHAPKNREKINNVQPYLKGIFFAYFHCCAAEILSASNICYPFISGLCIWFQTSYYCLFASCTAPHRFCFFDRI